MVKTIFLVTCLAALQNQVLSQCPRQLNFLQQIQPEVIEQPRSYITQQAPRITDSPCNCQVPLNPAAPSSTTIITDCSPTACKNLANTLQLMIVCNLLQNTKGGSELALQLAAPIINELFTSPVLSCGCTNPFAANAVSPNIVGSNIISPNFVSPNVISPNFISGISNAVSSASPFLQLTAGGLLSGVF